MIGHNPSPIRGDFQKYWMAASQRGIIFFDGRMNPEKYQNTAATFLDLAR